MRAAGGRARQLALGMTYPDTIRVAGLSSVPRVLRGFAASWGLANMTCSKSLSMCVPASKRSWTPCHWPGLAGLVRSAGGIAFLRKFVSRGRIIRTTSLGGFLLLYAIASLKPLRRRSLRFARETECLEEWLDTVWAAAKRDVQLATSFALARGLLRGYGETYERGFKKFRTICEFVQSKNFKVSADSVRALAAAADAEDGMGALETAIARLTGAKQAETV